MYYSSGRKQVSNNPSNQNYHLHAVAAVDVSGAALIARLEVGGRHEESERKESKDASKLEHEE